MAYFIMNVGDKAPGATTSTLHQEQCVTQRVARTGGVVSWHAALCWRTSVRQRPASSKRPSLTASSAMACKRRDLSSGALLARARLALARPRQPLASWTGPAEVVATDGTS